MNLSLFSPNKGEGFFLSNKDYTEFWQRLQNFNLINKFKRSIVKCDDHIY
jgi:hypothetical protein